MEKNIILSLSLLFLLSPLGCNADNPVKMHIDSSRDSLDWQLQALGGESKMAPYGWQENMKDVVSPIEKKFHVNGPHKVEYIASNSNDEKIGFYSVWYPADMKGSANTYPLVVMVNGTGVPASVYTSIFEHLASWGFIVAGNQDVWSGSGRSSEMTLAFMLSENKRQDSPLFAHIDTENIGVAGHSQGGSGTFNAITAWPNSHRYKAAVSMSPTHLQLAIDLLKAGYDVSKITIPIMITASTGMNTFLHDPSNEKNQRICDITDMREEMNTIRKAHPEVPVVIGRLSDDTKIHGDNLMESEPYIAAWFNYWLKGDKKAGKAFFGKKSEIKKNKRWRDVEVVR